MSLKSNYGLIKQASTEPEEPDEPEVYGEEEEDVPVYEPASAPAYDEYQEDDGHYDDAATQMMNAVRPAQSEEEYTEEYEEEETAEEKEERREIAHNGFEKVAREYNYPLRLSQMLSLAFSI